MTEIVVADHNGQELVIDTSQVVAVEECPGDTTVTLHLATGYQPYWRTKKTEDATEPVPDVTPCLRSSNCTLTHNHRGDCELRYP